MAGTITALVLQKNNKERVNVFLNDQYAFAVTALVAATLRKGQYLSDTDIASLKDQDDLDKAYNQAIRFLSFRPRSQMEVERYLSGKGYAAEVVQETITRLLQQQYLDDEAFARFWLENRERFGPRGEQALRYELKQKGIAPEVLDTVLSSLDETEAAWAAVMSKLYRWKNLPEEDFKKKVFSFLSRRGFDYEVANQTVRRAWLSLTLEE